MSGNLPAIPGPSVLPDVRADYRADGTVALVRVPAEGNTSSFALGGVALAGAVAVFALSRSSLIVFGVFLLFVAFWQLGRAGWKTYQRRTLSDAELVLPRLPLRMGEPMSVSYSQRRTGRSNITALSAVLSCTEWVEYQQGTTTSSQTHKLWEQPLPQAIADPLGDAELLRGTWQLRLPPELPPSFSAPHNSITWRLTIHVAVQDRPDISNAFVLPVTPEVVRDLR